MPNVTTLPLANDMANPSVCLSVCLSSVISVVCDVRALYSGSLTFREYFCTILQPGHPATHPPKITKIVQGDPPLRANLPNRRMAVRLL